MRNLRQYHLTHAKASFRLNDSQSSDGVRKAYIPKKRFIAALAGSCGIIKAIADKLGVGQNSVRHHLARPDWEDVRTLHKDEVENGVDIAHMTVLDAITQRQDIGVASLNARWLLSKKRASEFGDQSTVKVEGGDKPIKHAHVILDVGTLDIPVEQKRILLEALNRQEEVERVALEGAVATSTIKPKVR